MLRWIRWAVVAAVLAGALAAVLMPRGAAADELPPRPTPAEPSTQERAERHADGRIAGAVVDLSTGRPAAGVTVIVGGVAVLADANGNYERAGLEAGSYEVALALAYPRDAPAQGPVTLAVGEGQTVVQNLAFYSATCRAGSCARHAWP
jgi:hypothetical protein